MMQQDADLLEAVHTTAEMGKNTLEELLSKSADAEFSDVIRTQQKTYEETAAQARALLLKGGVTPQQRPLTDAMAALGLRLNTMMDKSSSHMAQMMIEGSTMGVVELQRQLNCHPDAGGEAKKLARGLMAFEQKSIEALKPYL